MTHPKAFWLDYVLPAVREWESAKLDVRRAIIALCQIDNLTEHYIVWHLSPSLTNDERRQAVRSERNRLASISPAIGLARDVHDTHKHGLLARKKARIKLGQRPEEASSGHLLFAALGEVAIGGSISELAIVLDDGSQTWVSGIIRHCLDFWEREIAALS
jgi:hypothetical protein